MNDVKEKVKGFVKDNKVKLIVGGVVVSYAAYKLHIHNIKKEAFLRGGNAGFHATMNWFDNNFSDLNLNRRWEQWAIANPDKVRHF